VEKDAKPSYLNFDKKNYSWKNNVDYRTNQELYRVGKGEQGVLICEPYKSEIGIYWFFKTPDIANESAQKILELFNAYLDVNDFVGADMARKYLQMGFTRARRYANYKGGKKYDEKNDFFPLKKGTGDPIKAASANIFYVAWKEAESNEQYKMLKKKWKKNYG
jgi:hypothetical protein